MLNPVDTIKILQNNGQPKIVTARKIIFEEGEQGEVMYGIITGEVELWVNGKVAETIEPGDVFGEGALVDPEHKRASTAIAKTDCELVTLDREHFLFAIQETPLFAIEVMRSFSHRLRYLKHHTAN